MPVAQQQKLALSQAHGPMALLIHFYQLHHPTPAWPGQDYWLYTEMILERSKK